MNDAQALFREAVLLFREHRDANEARRLLVESLRLNPQNEMAWVWLARTVNTPAKKLECIERALKINPENQQALEMKAQLGGQPVVPVVPVAEPAPEPEFGIAEERKSKDKKQGDVLTLKEQKQIALLMKKAEHLLEADDTEAAIVQWVDVLHIQVDHEEAMRNAVSHLARMKYLDDAQELLQRAIDAGTEHPSIYLTAIDVARRTGDVVAADAFREDLVRLPEVTDDVIVQVAKSFTNTEQPSRALDLLQEALEAHPDSQPIMTALGDLHELLDNKTEAMRFYDQAARMGAGTKAGKEADKKLSNFAPVLTDRERGSVLLAGREAAGFGLVYIFLAWQDAGLDLLQLGLMRWLGVLLGIVGGYLVVTATSSPQQQPVAQWLGGVIPDKRKYKKKEEQGLIEEISEIPMIPPATRLVLGVAGGALLVIGILLVLSVAIGLLLNPQPPPDIPTLFDLMEGRWR
jgi:tetratricopeptide (TPR) repeat protein